MGAPRHSRRVLKRRHCECVRQSRGKFMKLKKKPIASAVALALMSAVTPMHAQESDTKSTAVSTSESQPDASAAQAAKDKAKAAKAAKAKAKAAAAKDAVTAGAKTEQGEPQTAQTNIILAQASP